MPLWALVLAYDLGNFMRRLALPEDLKHCTLTNLQTRLIKTGARLVRHGKGWRFSVSGARRPAPRRHHLSRRETGKMQKMASPFLTL